MRKATTLVVILVLTFTAATALASGAVYSDDELGFSFEMPSDFEYYADLADQAAKEDGITMQPMYVGYDANVSVTYSDGADEYENLVKRLPDGVAQEELDFYMMPERDKEEYMQSVTDELGQIVQNGSIVSAEWKDYGGKLCVYIVMEGKDEASGMLYYQASLSFMYNGYFIAITYTKVNADEGVTIDEAVQEFEECFGTLAFDVVPSDKELKIKTGIDWTQVAIWAISGAAAGGSAWFVVYLIMKKRDKKKFSGGSYGNGIKEDDNKDGGAL